MITTKYLILFVSIRRSYRKEYHFFYWSSRCCCLCLARLDTFVAEWMIFCEEKRFQANNVAQVNSYSISVCIYAVVYRVIPIVHLAIIIIIDRLVGRSVSFFFSICLFLSQPFAHWHKHAQSLCHSFYASVRCLLRVFPCSIIYITSNE